MALTSALVFLAFAGLLVFCEGLCSFALFAKRILANPVSASLQGTHSQPDPEIGHVNIPDALLKDPYGPGTTIKINGAGIRSDRETKFEPSPGQKRIVCSGDSFTFGFGVNQNDTWCEKLSSTKVESLNFGQIGYGLDQSYLHFKRDAQKFHPHLHVFAFIYDDIERMKTNYFAFYKPKLELKGQALEVIPPPATTGFMPFLSRNATHLRSLKMLELPLKLLEKSALYRDIDLQPLVMRVFDDLSALGDVVFVYLPTEKDLREDRIDIFGARDEKRLAFRRSLKSDLLSRGLRFLDLTDEMDRLSVNRRTPLFAPDGHYSVQGHSFIASKLKVLLGLDDIRQVSSERK